MKQLTEHEAKLLLKKNNIPIPRGTLASNELEAKNIAASIGGRVVMKICSPDIIHKSEFGGVILNVDYREADVLYKELIIRAGRAKVDGVLVEEMLSGYELIVGLKQDPQFGQIIMVGMGGIYTEVYKDVSFRVAPITTYDAHKMLRELKGFKILTGIRGKEKINLEKLTDVIVKVSSLNNIIELDINPLIVNSSTAIVADARTIIKE